MMKQSDRLLFLFVVLVFGISATVAGGRWLSSGSIVIRGGSKHGPQPADARVEGQIKPPNLLYYPLCLSWISLGFSMTGLAVLAFLTSKELFLRLCSYSCVAILLLAFSTVAAALYSGPG